MLGGVYPEKTETMICKDLYIPVLFYFIVFIPMFLAALFTTAKIWKQAKCP